MFSEQGRTALFYLFTKQVVILPGEQAYLYLI